MIKEKVEFRYYSGNSLMSSQPSYILINSVFLLKFPVIKYNWLVPHMGTLNTHILSRHVSSELLIKKASKSCRAQIASPSLQVQVRTLSGSST